MNFAPVISWGEWNWSGSRLLVRCPGCGQYSELAGEVADSGFTEREISCPVPSCGFHDFVCLEGW